MKKLFALIFFLAVILSFVSPAWAQKSEEFDVTFEQDVSVEGRFEANSTTKPNRPCSKFTQVERNSLPSPEAGDCVFNTTTNQLNIHNGSDWASAGGGGISNWAAATDYKANDVVIESLKIYQANTDHTSTVFASDIANWTLISDNLPVDLTTDVGSSVLPMANGGTDKNLTPTLGGVVYTDANSMEVLGAGTSGQVLKSNGAAAPTWQDSSNKIQAQDLTEQTFTKLETPNRSVVSTAAGVQLVDTSANLLYNGGFEASSYLDGWTCSGGSTSPETGTLSVIGLKSVYAVGTVSDGVTCYQDFPVNQQKRGMSLLISIVARASGSKTKICYRENGVVTTICSEGLNGTIATEAVIGSSATSIGFQFQTDVGIGAVTRVDEAKMEYGTAVTNQPAIGQEIAYTPVFTNVNTPTNINFTYQQIGSNLRIKGYYTGAGGTSTNELRIGLPSGMTTSTRINPIQSLGVLNSSYSAAFDGAIYVIATSNKAYLNVGLYTSGASGLSVANISSVGFASGRNYSFDVLVPINELASSVPTYTGRCNDPRACETVFSAKISSTGVVSSENLDWINGNATIASTSFYTLTFNTGIFSVAPNCLVTPTQTSSYESRFSSESASSVTAQFFIGNGNPTATAFNISCQRQGQDFLNAKTLQQNVALKNYSQTIPPSDGTMTDDFMVSFGQANVGTTSVTNCTTSPCAFDVIGTGTVSSVTRAGNGLYDIVTSRTYKALKCTGTALSVALGQRFMTGTLQCKNCNTMRIEVGYNGASYDGAGTVHCKGYY